jgi:hypothetical protein
MEAQKFIKLDKTFFADEQSAELLQKAGLTSIDEVFKYSGGDELVKENIGKHRSRTMIEIEGKTYFLKRYTNTPMSKQIANWIDHGQKKSTADYDRGPVQLFEKADILTPKTVAYGCQWKLGFEKRSFIITEKIASAQSLEKRLPDCFYGGNTPGNHKRKCEFIEKLARFAKRFHQSKMRHRDFYFAHLFLNTDDELYLIDLQRVFMPEILSERYRVKDIAQLHYSAPGDIVSCSDRMRFLKHYLGKENLTFANKRFLRKVKFKAWHMADHDIKHGRSVPFAK